MTFLDTLDDLQEQFHDYYERATSDSSQLPVWKNPTSKEMDEILKETAYDEVKFIVDTKNKDVYVFSGDKTIHNAVGSKIFGEPVEHKPRYVLGYANPVTRKVTRIRGDKKDEVDYIYTKSAIKPPITFKPKKTVNEVFAEYGKSSYEDNPAYPIFKNPTSKDVMEMKKETGSEYGFRLLADKKNKDVYMFDASLLHNEAIAAITGKPDYSSQRFVRGYANMKLQIDEFYPDDEILNVVDWVTKGNILTWPELIKEKEQALKKKEDLEAMQKRLGKKPMVVRKQTHVEKEKLKAKLDAKRKSLSEVFVDLAKPSGRAYGATRDHGIYKNPTSKEFRELIKEEDPQGIRLLVDRKKKEVYVFNSDLLHDDAERVVYGRLYPLQKDSDHLKGFANKKGEINFFRHVSKKVEEEVREWITKGPLTWPEEK